MRLPAASAASLVALGALLLGACGARAAAPAWPKAAEVEPGEDGGESLAPRQPVLVAATEKEKEVEASAAEEPAAEEPAVEEPAPAAEPSTPVITAPEEVINLDDIVIEIEEE